MKENSTNTLDVNSKEFATFLLKYCRKSKDIKGLDLSEILVHSSYFEAKPVEAKPVTEEIKKEGYADKIPETQQELEFKQRLKSFAEKHGVMVYVRDSYATHRIVSVDEGKQDGVLHYKFNIKELEKIAGVGINEAKIGLMDNGIVKE